MKSWFRIAGKNILIEGAGSRARRFFRGFESGEGEPFMTFKAELPGEEAISSGSEEELLFGLRVTYMEGSWPWRFDARQSSREYLLASSDFTSCRIISKPIITGEMPDDPADEPRWRGLILGAMAAKGALSGMLLAHASAVEYEGEAVIFTAPSGSGKTTQAELWNRYLKARILNGDKVFISREEDGFYAYGSPWAGSSPYRENHGAPMRAVTFKRGRKMKSGAFEARSSSASLFRTSFFPTGRGRFLTRRSERWTPLSQPFRCTFSPAARTRRRSSSQKRLFSGIRCDPAGDVSDAYFR